MEAGRPPTCDGAADCQAKWDAAQEFLAKRAGLAIRVATSTLIETDDPKYERALIVMKVTKVPLEGGRFQLVAEARCNFATSCRPRARRLVADFNSYIPRATP